MKKNVLKKLIIIIINNNKWQKKEERKTRKHNIPAGGGSVKVVTEPNFFHRTADLLVVISPHPFTIFVQVVANSVDEAKRLHVHPRTQQQRHAPLQSRHSPWPCYASSSSGRSLSTNSFGERWTSWDACREAGRLGGRGWKGGGGGGGGGRGWRAVGGGGLEEEVGSGSLMRKHRWRWEKRAWSLRVYLLPVRI